jgi:FkbM family methyltransferase
MGILRGAVSSYSLFGPYGVALVAKARLLRQSTKVSVSITGFKWPVQIRLRTSDVSLLSEMLGSAEYNLDFPSPPRVIVDAGANTGLTSVFYANKYPQARVLAIEPESSNFELLKENTAPYANIVCIQAALWKSNTRITITDPGLGHWGFQTREDVSEARSNEVEGITIDNLMARFAIDYIDFLRVDIEVHDRLKTGCSRAVYLATRDFQWELRRGETVFLGREQSSAKEILQPAASADFPNTSPRRARGRRPCAIVSAT